MQDRGFDDVMSDIRALNGPFRVFAPAIQAGFTTRLKTEQAAIRKIVIRMDTMRRTSYVSAGYLIAEVTAAALMFVLIITDLGKPGPSLFLVGLLSYLLFYLVGLIRDLDNPFEYLNGKPGAADVNLDVLERNEDRLRALLGALDPAPSRARAHGRTAGRAHGAVALTGTSHGRGPWRSVHGDPGEGPDRHGSPLPRLAACCSRPPSSWPAAVATTSPARPTSPRLRRGVDRCRRGGGVRHRGRAARQHLRGHRGGGQPDHGRAGRRLRHPQPRRVSYVGPLRDDGSFATAAAQVPVGADTHALAVTGTFGDDGFDAQVVAEVTGGQTCGYKVAWTGHRSSRNELVSECSLTYAVGHA